MTLHPHLLPSKQQRTHGQVSTTGRLCMGGVPAAKGAGERGVFRAQQIPWGYQGSLLSHHLHSAAKHSSDMLVGHTETAFPAGVHKKAFFLQHTHTNETIGQDKSCFPLYSNKSEMTLLVSGEELTFLHLPSPEEYCFIFFKQGAENPSCDWSCVINQQPMCNNTMRGKSVEELKSEKTFEGAIKYDILFYSINI